MMTTSDGRFVVRSLRRGEYQLEAVKPGYIAGWYGARRPFGPSLPVTLAEGERRTDVVIRLWKHASISGMVVDEAGEPLVDVHVIALRRTFVAGRPRFEPVESGSTDDRGIYRIPGLQPGHYIVSVPTSNAAVPLASAQQLEEMMAQSLPALPTPNRLHLAMMEIGATPVGGMTSMARMVGDQVQTLSGPTPPPFDGSKLYAYPTLFYPNATTVEAATSFPVTAGQERTGIDLQLKPVPTARVSGMVIGPADMVGGVAVRLTRRGAQEGMKGVSSPGTVTEATGRFTFIGVPAGDYVLRAAVQPLPTVTPVASAPTRAGSSIVNTTIVDFDTPLSSDQQASWAIVPLSVGDADLTEVNVTLRAGVRVTGRFEFDGSIERPAAEQLSQIRVSLDAADGRAAERFGRSYGRIDRSGRFATQSVPAGAYFLGLDGLPRGWSLKSVSAAERDVSDSPLELESADLGNVVIILTDRPASLSGTIDVGSAGSRDNVVVVLFPTDPKAWTDTGANPRRLRRRNMTPSGAYEMSNLLAGEYYVAATTEEAIEDFPDPALLERLAGVAARVQVGAGEKPVQHLRIQEIR
jgi:hypothetical protein